MGGVDNGCGSRLLKVTSNNILQIEHYMKQHDRLMLFHMKNDHYLQQIGNNCITWLQYKVKPTPWHSGSGGICEVVLMVAPDWRSTLTTLA